MSVNSTDRYADPNSLLMGGSTSAKFDTHGATIAGRVTEYFSEQDRDMDSGAPKTWDDGTPKMLLVITVQTDQGNPVDGDDGSRRLYVRGQMLKAIRDAVRRAGARGIDIGGTLSVTYTGDGEPTKRGWTPPKLYAATYTAPSVAAANDLLNAAPAPAAAAAEETVQGVVLDQAQVDALRAMGVKV